MALRAPHFPPHFQTSVPMMENASYNWTQLVWMGTSWQRHPRFYLGLMSFRKLLMGVDTPPAIIFHLCGPPGPVGSSATSFLSTSFHRGGVVGWGERRDWVPFQQQCLNPRNKTGRQTKKASPGSASIWQSTLQSGGGCFGFENDIAGADSIVSLCLVRHKLLWNNKLR